MSMKTRWLSLITLVLAAAFLFLPLATLEVHSQIAPEIASQFPRSISLMDVLLHGAELPPWWRLERERKLLRKSNRSIWTGPSSI